MASPPAKHGRRPVTSISASSRARHRRAAGEPSVRDSQIHEIGQMTKCLWVKLSTITFSGWRTEPQVRLSRTVLTEQPIDCRRRPDQSATDPDGLHGQSLALRTRRPPTRCIERRSQLRCCDRAPFRHRSPAAVLGQHRSVARRPGPTGGRSSGFPAGHVV